MYSWWEVLLIISATIWQIVLGCWILQNRTGDARNFFPVGMPKKTTAPEQQPIKAVEVSQKKSIQVDAPDSHSVKMDEHEKKTVVTQKDKLKQLRRG
tara:strand:- start:786 stop:1076 length:291 start_codon:yes stop_codon:yes gene_type:complete